MDHTPSHVLITGGAGFIGSHLADAMLSQGWKVTVVDSFDPYYDPAIKRANVAPNLDNSNYRLVEADIQDPNLPNLLKDHYDVIVHLAARAGVRPSIKDPVAYSDTNVKGTQNLLEFARDRGITQFVFASSSSVYGINPNVPWHEDDKVLQPISPYASTKVSGELLGHVYSHLYGIRFIALRFFTVFGPRQRPDLAINKFARLITQGEPITMFGDGSTRRDYTFVGDIVQGILGAVAYDKSMFEVINLGNCRTISLSQMIASIEQVFGQKATIEQLPEQPGDVPQTFADISRAQSLLGYHPETSFEEGLEAFKKWMFARMQTAQK
ncbi:GDP-mannose 4,6-dehydratase [Pontibacter sp. G13]|uniref:GDP-mannose 4,6-dehydratase n=1 Tax=Pontibacter sp. G13 TaxID=3074898 RepID=UPI00288C41B8|nr:GDP-mannose 4,6-dehydratase [Pontibacter sp. G13]WNJ19767.1 GDP-mannose 4,6-dehydratase [Pontibacter sp. G13]